MDVVVVVVCGLLGLAFGSFANVVIHRVPEGSSLAWPASACPHCGQRIGPADNLPVISWLRLRGRCRDCGERISLGYPAVELATGVLFAGVGARVGLDWALPGFLLFAWTLLVVAVIDARTQRIPNRLTYPLVPGLLALLVLAAFANAEPSWALRSLLGGLVSFGVLLGLALLSPQGIGMGDVKLAAFVGIGLGYLGWGHVVLGMFAAFALGGLVAMGLLVTRLRGRRDLIPFGPYLAVAGLLALLLGGPLVDAYREFIGL